MRRRPGIGAIQKQKIQQEKFKEKGVAIQENQLGQMKHQMEKFRENLEDFSSKYKQEIKKDSTLRKQFQEMCASIGVDPLASGKGFWCEVLGVGDFYYEVGVRLVELGVATSHRNGGVMPLEEAVRRLNARKKTESRVSEDDIMRAIKKLQILGSGLEIMETARSKFICTIPGELSMDHTILLQEAEKSGQVTPQSASESLKWSIERTSRALDHLLTIGVAWRDDQSKPPSFWFPAFFMAGTLDD